MRNAINWFELPAGDLDRAITFYSAILGTDLGEVMEADDRRYVMFPAEDGVAGALVQGPGYTPSKEGALLFLGAGESLQAVLDRVEAAGGQVLFRRDMGDWGKAGFILDTEGNRVVLHATGD
jgi:uncharacterized protein